MPLSLLFCNLDHAAVATVLCRQKTSVERVTGEEATPTAVTVTYVNVDKDTEKPMTHSTQNAKLYR